jgi:hypothetical protein
MDRESRLLGDLITEPSEAESAECTCPDGCIRDHEND